MSNAKTTLKNEIRLVPAWAYLLAVALFVAFQFLLGFAWRHTPNPPPAPVQILIRTFPGIILAFVALLIGTFTQARAWLGHFTRERYAAVQNTALYWHFMDGLWIYLLLLLTVRL